MSSHPVWFVGNRSPSIAETITIDGAPVDLTGTTVKFKMRPVGATTLKVDTAAQIVNPPGVDGQVRYDWVANDVDTAGTYLVWWEVTTTATGKKQDLNEAIIEFRAHAPVVSAYVELEQLRSTLELSATFADPDIQIALVAASRGVDKALGRRPGGFLKDTVDQTRYYTAPERCWYTRDRHHRNFPLQIDDLVALTTLKTAPANDGSFSETWAVSTDFVLEPQSAPTDGEPYTKIRRLPAASFWWPRWDEAIAVTGKFGWPEVPAAVKELTTLIATRLLRRTREAPFGIVAVGLEGAAVRAASFARDPEYAFLIDAVGSRKKLFV